jgi:serine/threonine protein kinase
MWIQACVEYKLIKIIGRQSGEELIKAQHKLTKQMVEIKVVHTNFDDQNEIRKIITEIQILKYLSRAKNNVHTVKLVDIIISKNFEDNCMFLVMD